MKNKTAEQKERKRMEMQEEIYSLNINNFDKKKPENYNALIIPEIEKVTKYIMGDLIKNKIYNYIVYYYNAGKTEGCLKTLWIQKNDGQEGRIYYKIRPEKITLEIKNEKFKLT